MTLPREIIRWLQSLDLPFPVKHPKRDLANGYLFAEICARYWPNVAMHSFENKHSQKEKEGNWQILTKAFVKNNFVVEAQVIASVISQDDGYAEHVLLQLYSALTKRQIQQFPPLAAAAVEQVPTFIRTNAPAQQVQSPTQGATSPSPAQAQRSAADEEARSEAEKRAALARQQARARATQKPQAIKADDGSSAQAVPIQFAAVQVKPLPAHLMSRLGGGANRDARRDSDAGSSSTFVSHEDSVVGLIARQITTVLGLTASAPFHLTTSCPDNATFFAKNISLIENSLRSIIWSQLNAQTEAVAMFLLQRPADYTELVGLFADLLFARPSAENFSLTYVASINQAMAAHSPQAALAICQMFALPQLRQTITSLSAAQADLAATLVSSFLSPRAAETSGYVTHLVSIVYEAICGAGGDAPAQDGVPRTSSASSAAQRSFLLVLSQLVLKTASTKKTAARHNRSSDADVSTDDLRSASLIDPSVLSVAHYNIVAGLHHESSSVRTAALLLLLAVASCGEVPMVLDLYFDLLQRVLFGSGAGVMHSNEDVVIGLNIFSAVTPHCFASDATAARATAIVERLMEVAGGDSAGQCSACVRVYVAHVLCRVAHLVPAALSLPSRLLRLLLLESSQDLRSKLFAPAASAAPVYVSALLGPLVAAATHRSWYTSVFVEALLELGKGDKQQEPAERRVALTKSAAAVLKTGGIDPTVAMRVQYLHLFLVEGRTESDSTVRSAADGSGSADEGEVARWWANLQTTQPDVDFAIYCGELVSAQRAKAVSEAASSTLLPLAALAQQVAVRLFVDLSGLHTSASAHDGPYTEDPALMQKACAWIRSLSNS
jgi:hypothetical protein